MRGLSFCSTAPCSTDGQSGCVTSDDIVAAVKANIAGKVYIGESVAGVVGTRSSKPAGCKSDGAIGCVTVNQFPAVDKSNVLTANAGKIKSGVVIAGVSESLPTYNGTSNVNKAIDVSNITSGVVKNGTTLAGITGDYPSATHPLAVGDGFTDLTTGNFATSISSASIQREAVRIKSGLIPRHRAATARPVFTRIECPISNGRRKSIVSSGRLPWSDAQV
ncbi:MAG: hypothetical protein H7249_04545 [Chitinophagaceae bacterium]|nr:hypothetical protein [Oligoflexus sp.]